MLFSHDSRIANVLGNFYKKAFQMSHSNLHFYEAPAGSGLAILAEQYATEILSPISEALKGLDRSTLQFSHKNGEWKIKPIKERKKDRDSSLAQTFDENSHPISFPDFGTFVSQKADRLFNLGTASCFPSGDNAFFIACEKPLPKRLKIYTEGTPHVLLFGNIGVRMADDHYVPSALQGIKFHKEPKPEVSETESLLTPAPSNRALVAA